MIEKCNPKNKILICFVGRLLQVKGVKYLIQAAKRIDKEIQEKIKKQYLSKKQGKYDK
ncbi:MAG: glycosyltransferase [Candidatus Aenigmarchaeota archaeon]|nr:glycosyltransferase [Candidatus Aenigmarchaeota archaeon]